jgi:hypothetical protein
MSPHRWLQSVRSALTPARRQHRSLRPGSRRAGTHRPHLELLEDRVTPSLVLVSFSETQPQVPIEWSPAPYWATADFNGDGRLDLLTAEDHYWEGLTLVQLALGTPAGGFSLWQSDYYNIYPTALGIGDALYLADGRPDVVIAGYDRTYGTFGFWVLGNDGDWGGSEPPPDLPRLGIDNTTVAEGNAGRVAATFNVSLSAPSPEAITVAYATGDGTATDGDYQATSGTLTFAPGETSKTITVIVLGDRLGEPNETFVVNLTNPANATIDDGQGAGTIVDDEPRISISNVSKAEGRQGRTTLFTFTVTLSAVYDEPVTMSFATANGTARASDNDYVAKSGTLTFAPGETTKTITIEVKGDSKREANETFYLDLFGLSGNGLFTKSRGIGTILNDD